MTSSTAVAVAKSTALLPRRTGHLRSPPAHLRRQAKMAFGIRAVLL